MRVCGQSGRKGKGGAGKDSEKEVRVGDKKKRKTDFVGGER